ncbi:hypothetical protein H9L01_09950 [Erysipelothrix inopinata]|uniref:Uncharacterized protein n=1 Tax=Erysipelothrix inopinata TaxID=225084 RepID=A0A7G9RYJ9_9FIRM|nr:hypothetical protein [Erysipelothrix inopinata]QNN60674.1 hypothetical protein H9L01_09950 [Erysipelothrix inopinata]
MISKSKSRFQQFIRAILIIYYWFVCTAALITLSEKLNFNSQIVSIIAFSILVLSIIIFGLNIIWYQKDDKKTTIKLTNNDLNILVKKNLWIVSLTSLLLLVVYWMMQVNYQLEYFAILVSFGLVPPLAWSFIKMVRAKTILNRREESL